MERVKPQPTTVPAGALLESWKEIAQFLKRDVRTARRWERERGLPVHRIPGPGKPAVFAVKSELEAWRSRTRLHVLQDGNPREGRPAASAQARPSIAVLPFANPSSDKENEYFGDGLADQIITNLCRVPGLRVTARTSSFAFRGKERDVREIGEVLGVQCLLEGSVRQSANRIRVSAQLIDCVEGFHIWAETYDRELADIFAIQDEISASIVGALRLRLGHEEPPGRRGTKNLEAYCEWLRARHCFYQMTPASLAESVRYCRRAIELDPGYAPAYAALAESLFDSANYSVTPVRPALAEGRAAAVRALELDPSLGEARAMMGAFRALDTFDWDAAESAFLAALETSPASPVVHSRYAWSFLTPMSRLEEATAELEVALDLDPLSPYCHTLLAQIWMFRRRYDRAEAHLGHALALAPDFWMAQWYRGAIAALQGRVQEGLEIAAQTPRFTGTNPLCLGVSGALFGWAGRKQEAHAVLEELLARTEPASSLAVAWVYLGLGETDRVFACLERAVAEREPMILHLPTKPFYDHLRSDPRFQELLRRMRLAV